MKITPSCKIWIGKYIMAVSVLHTAAALYEFWDIWQEMAKLFFLNIPVTYPTGATLWFFVSGIYMFTLGAVINWHEEYIDLPLPKALNYGILCSTLTIIIIMPQSGAWLFIPAIWGLFKKEKQDQRALNW